MVNVTEMFNRASQIRLSCLLAKKNKAKKKLAYRTTEKMKLRLGDESANTEKNSLKHRLKQSKIGLKSA